MGTSRSPSPTLAGGPAKRNSLVLGGVPPMLPPPISPYRDPSAAPSAGDAELAITLPDLARSPQHCHPTLLQSIVKRDIEIPPHIDVYLVRGETERSDINAMDFIVVHARILQPLSSLTTSASTSKPPHISSVSGLRDLHPSADDWEGGAGRLGHSGMWLQGKVPKGN